jgi:hypothetical protein
MSLLTPHAERRFQAPLRTLAMSGENWRGLSRSKLAEQYARHRAEMNEAMKMVEAESERFTSKPRKGTATASGQGWFNRLLQLLGLAQAPDHTFT